MYFKLCLLRLFWVNGADVQYAEIPSDLVTKYIQPENDLHLERDKIILEMTSADQRRARSTHGAGSAVWRSRSVSLDG